MIFPYGYLEDVHLISLELPYWKVLRMLFGRPQDAGRRYPLLLRIEDHMGTFS